MIVPQLLGDMKDWAQKLIAALTYELPQDLQAAAAPNGALILYQGAAAPEGWVAAPEINSDYMPPAGYIWVRKDRD